MMKRSICRMLAVGTALVCFLGGPSAMHVSAAGRTAVSSKSLIPEAEKQKMREALEEFRRLGFSPMDIVQHLLNGEESELPWLAGTENGDGIISQIQGAAQEAGDGIIGQFQSAAQEAGDGIVSQVQDTAQEAGDEIIGQVQDAAQEQAESWASQMKENVRESLHDFIDGIFR